MGHQVRGGHVIVHTQLAHFQPHFQTPTQILKQTPINQIRRAIKKNKETIRRIKKDLDNYARGRDVTQRLLVPGFPCDPLAQVMSVITGSEIRDMLRSLDTIKSKGI